MEFAWPIRPNAARRSILILAPMVGYRRLKQEETAANIDTDAKEERKQQLVGFRAVYVFDVTQTEGKDLPTLTEIQGDVSGYRERLFGFVEAQGIELVFHKPDCTCKGSFSWWERCTGTGMQPAEEFSTLVHEIGHEMLHRGDRRTLTTKQVRETEAEAVSFVVCQAVGLQTGTSSQDYIQLWHGDADLLRESLEAVQHTAAVILEGITPEPVAATDRVTRKSPQRLALMP